MHQLIHRHHTSTVQTMHLFVTLSPSAAVQSDHGSRIHRGHPVPTIDIHMGPQSGQGDSSNCHPLSPARRRKLRLVHQPELRQALVCAKTFMQ